MNLRGRFDAVKLYQWLRVTQGLLFGIAAALNPVYRIETVGLDAFQLVILGTILEITIFSCEVPTGVVADTVSRRLSVIIGSCCCSYGCCGCCTNCCCCCGAGS